MSSLIDTIDRVLQKIHKLATPHKYRTPQQGKKYTDRGRFRDVQIGPKVCAPTRSAKVLLYHLLNRSLPTQKELDLDPVFQDSAAAVHATLLLGPDCSLVPGEVVLDHAANWIGVRFGGTQKALDQPLTVLQTSGPVSSIAFAGQLTSSRANNGVCILVGSVAQLTQSQLSGLELDAKKWAMTTEYALTVFADLAAPSVLYKLLEKPLPPLPGWTSLNAILGGKGSGNLLSAKLLEHIRTLGRAEFKAELRAPGGMACTIAQGTERKRNIDPSHLILHPSRMAKHARLQDDGTINASSYSFCLSTGSAALALAKRPPSTTSTTVRAAARQKKADGLKIGFFFRSAADQKGKSDAVYAVDTYFTNEAGADFIKLATGS